MAGGEASEAAGGSGFGVKHGASEGAPEGEDGGGQREPPRDAEDAKGEEEGAEGGGAGEPTSIEMTLEGGRSANDELGEPPALRFWPKEEWGPPASSKSAGAPSEVRGPHIAPGMPACCICRRL